MAPQDTRLTVNTIQYCPSIWIICTIVWIRIHSFLICLISLEETRIFVQPSRRHLSYDDWLLNGCFLTGEAMTWGAGGWLPEPRTLFWSSLWSLQVHTARRRPGGLFSEVWRVFCHYCSHFPECFLHIFPIVECTSAHETEPTYKKQPV